MWLIFHVGLDVGPFYRFRCQPGPLTRFVHSQFFFLWRWICSLPGWFAWRISETTRCSLHNWARTLWWKFQFSTVNSIWDISLQSWKNPHLTEIWPWHSEPNIDQGSKTHFQSRVVVKSYALFFAKLFDAELRKARVASTPSPSALYWRRWRNTGNGRELILKRFEHPLDDLRFKKMTQMNSPWTREPHQSTAAWHFSKKCHF